MRRGSDRNNGSMRALENHGRFMLSGEAFSLCVFVISFFMKNGAGKGKLQCHFCDVMTGEKCKHLKTPQPLESRVLLRSLEMQVFIMIAFM